MSIRTTVTLDEDVMERVQRESKVRGASFRETLNDLLRLGLLAAAQRPARRTLRIEPVPMGRKDGLNFDDVAALLEYAEGELRR
ncbi:MAG: hypothetical protein IT165_22940 [Bryobacterales bacterium]|nr:hypothetical protein [Bryobacterales bacterium]